MNPTLLAPDGVKLDVVEAYTFAPTKSLSVGFVQFRLTPSVIEDATKLVTGPGGGLVADLLADQSDLIPLLSTDLTRMATVPAGEPNNARLASKLRV